MLLKFSSSACRWAVTVEVSSFANSAKSSGPAERLSLVTGVTKSTDRPRGRGCLFGCLRHSRRWLLSVLASNGYVLALQEHRLRGFFTRYRPYKRQHLTFSRQCWILQKMFNDLRLVGRHLSR